VDLGSHLDPPSSIFRPSCGGSGGRVMPGGLGTVVVASNIWALVLGCLQRHDEDLLDACLH
jgi:hypothetical protein